MSYVWSPVMDDRLRPHVVRWPSLTNRHCAEAYSLTLAALECVNRREDGGLDGALERIRRHRATYDLCIVAEVMES